MNLKDLRQKAHLFQRQVAQALNISQSTVSMWETQGFFPETKLLPQLAKLYDCSISDLFECTRGKLNDDAQNENRSRFGSRI